MRDLLGPNIFAGRLSDEQQDKMRNPNVPPPKGFGGLTGGAPGTFPWAMPSGFPIAGTIR